MSILTDTHILGIFILYVRNFQINLIMIPLEEQYSTVVKRYLDLELNTSRSGLPSVEVCLHHLLPM